MQERVVDHLGEFTERGSAVHAQALSHRRQLAQLSFDSPPNIGRKTPRIAEAGASGQEPKKSSG
jgi:hypothetical protein